MPHVTEDEIMAIGRKQAHMDTYHNEGEGIRNKMYLIASTV